jgi:hypothetical protein
MLFIASLLLASRQWVSISALSLQLAAATAGAETRAQAKLEIAKAVIEMLINLVNM